MYRISVLAFSMIMACSSPSGSGGGEEEGASGEGGSSTGSSATGSDGKISVVPSVCVFNELNGKNVGEKESSSDDGPETMNCVVENGTLVEANGASCEPVTTWEINESSCQQHFVCGGCRWWIEKSVVASSWSIKGKIEDESLIDKEDPSCQPSYVEYDLGSGSASGGGSGTGSSAGSSSGSSTGSSTGSGGSSSCPSKCKFGSSCCQPPFCSGKCVGSPCC